MAIILPQRMATRTLSIKYGFSIDITNMTENFVIIPTKKFGVYGLRGQTAQQDYFGVYLRVNCSYTRTIIQHIINEGIKPYYIVYEYEDINKIRYKCNNIMQLCDFEHIEWDRVLEGE